ncbi:hypothetical protein N4241_10535 [Riemerella anatipestifer]|uniref:hypothetical protein n=1 Tax=Riemerella anatipestifer TaxID=34085 RepID=UPI0021D600F9|nr:hypothetical protein [Riemerella anatipestifer]MCU7571541.1 hypothetical protein [Riemerella anatipestifer]
MANETTMPATSAMTAFKTYRDTFEMTEDEGSLTEEFSDQDDNPIVVFQDKPKKNIKVSTYDYTPDFIKKVKGGTVVNGEWKEGDNTPIYAALEIEADTGHLIKYPKVQIFASFNLKLKKKELALLDVTFRPLSKVSIKQPE